MAKVSLKRYHVPFLALPFEVWQAGPVAKDVFIDLSDGPYILKDFVKTEVRETHKEGTLWYNMAKEHGLLDAFSKHECNNSDYRIDFSLALAPCVADSYRESLDIKQTATILKAGRNV